MTGANGYIHYQTAVIRNYVLIIPAGRLRL